VKNGYNKGTLSGPGTMTARRERVKGRKNAEREAPKVLNITALAERETEKPISEA